MATQQPEDSDTGTGGAPDATPTELSASGLSRRGFAKLGAGAGGVLLTLASQPGMAQTMCASPSQSLSKWKSHHTGQQLRCSGRLPIHWVKTYNSWPSPLQNMRSTLKFGAMYDCTSRPEYGDILVQKLLTLQPFDTAAIGQHFAAAYLNVKANKTSYLDIDTLRNMWREYVMSTTFKPTAGVPPWGANAIVSYLKSTMG